MKNIISKLDYIKSLHQSGATLFLILLLSADLAFIVLHTLEFMNHSITNPLLSLEMDQGFPEVFQYIKWFWIITLLTYLPIKRRSLKFSAWVGVFIYLLLDDALRIHETVGGIIADNLTMFPPFGLRVKDIGELIVTGVAGVFLVSFVLIAYIYGSKNFKKMSNDLFLLIFTLAFFGVFVDMLHISIQLGWKTTEVLAVIEDGGEMVIASIICWYVFLLSVRDKNATIYLLDFINLVLRRRST